jgi:C-terminal processing protease CtpA/Prc
MKNILLLIITVLLITSSCKKEVDNEVTPAMARDTLYYVMKQFYYWYNLMPLVTKEDYADPYELMDAMRYKPVDRWSFVADYDEFLAQMQGNFVGHGIRVGLDENDEARIAMIYKRSPLYALGVRRGWIVETVNGYDIAAIIKAGDSQAYNTAFGASVAGVSTSFVFRNPASPGTEIPITSVKSEFIINSVLEYDTLQLKSGVAGHLVFESFISPSEAELKTAFEYFDQMNVTDLILDLRYNSGGYLSVAQSLASYIYGNGHETVTFAKMEYNDKNQSENSVYKFKTTTAPLNMTRVVVITTRSTASASEAVMNGLLPHITVVSVGDTTNGKPTGMNGWDVAKKYIFWPVTFKIVNSANEGDYFEGFYPDLVVSDDITHDFHNRNELCLKGAIEYLETGSFPAKGTASFRRSVQFSEKPAWMNNTFVNGTIW